MNKTVRRAIRRSRINSEYFIRKKSQEQRELEAQEVKPDKK